MALNRRNALNQLVTVLGTASGIITVVRVFMEVDILNYSDFDMPLIAVPEPAEEADEEETDMHSMQKLATVIRIYFVEWSENPTATYQALMKAVRDAIGANFTLNGAATATWVGEIGPIQGEMPVYFFDMMLNMKYYLHQRAT